MENGCISWWTYNILSHESLKEAFSGYATDQLLNAFSYTYTFSIIFVHILQEQV